MNLIRQLLLYFYIQGKLKESNKTNFNELYEEVEQTVKEIEEANQSNLVKKLNALNKKINQLQVDINGLKKKPIKNIDRE